MCRTCVSLYAPTPHLMSTMCELSVSPYKSVSFPLVKVSSFSYNDI